MQGRIPRSFIDDLIARVDIVDLIDARVPLKKSGGNYVARCPFHDEKTPSFSVSRSKQFYYCFGCGAGGNAISFLMDYDHLNFVEAIEELASRLGLTVPAEASTSRRAHDGGNLAPLYDIQARAAALYGEQLRQRPEGRRAMDYLKSRGLNDVIAQTYRLGYAPNDGNLLISRLDRKTLQEAGLLSANHRHDLFRNRIIFPIRDRRGRIIGFGGRVLDDAKPKYLNSPETPTFHKSREVYGLYELLELRSKPNRILVVEGYMDVIALAQHGVTNAVATLGTATTKEHLELLFRHTSELIFCFDGDAAGRKAAHRAIETALPSLRDGRQVRIMLIPEGHDPDTLVRAEGAARFEERAVAATPLSDFFFEQLCGDLNLAEIEGCANLISRAKPLISQIPDGAFKELMLTKLKKIARVESLEIPEKTTRLTVRSTPAQSPRRIRVTPLRVAIALLLQHTKLARIAGGTGYDWHRLASPGTLLLQKILDLLEKNPELTLGGILERFRGQPEENQIRTLALWDTMIPEGGVETEFRDALVRLCEQASREQLERLLVKVKAEQGAISEQEREELRRLLTSSHNPRGS